VSKGGNWVTFTATNAYGSDSLRAYLEVMSAQYPVFTCPVHAAAEYGQPFELDLTALHASAGYRAWPLPSGLSLDGVTGRISGTPWAAGVHRVTVDASNSAGEMAILNLVINVRLPYTLWTQNFVLPAGREGPADDADGDGASNDNERMCGTNPQDPQDALVASINRDGDEWILTWKSVPGHFYRAQSTTLVDSGLWEDGTEIEAVESTCRLPLPAAPAQFWRIRLVP